MTRLSTRARAAAHWTIAAMFALFGVWTLSQWWMLLGTNADWRSLLVPFLATIGAVSLTMRAVEAAKRRPVPIRLLRARRE